MSQGAGPATKIAKELKQEDIRKHLEQLDSEMKTRGSPARLILVGKASAEMMKLEKPEDTEYLTAYHIDVVLDLEDTGEEIRRCMAKGKVFREFDKPLEHDGTKARKGFFGTNAHRAEVLRDAAREGKRIFPEIRHLQVYLMDLSPAFEFELRRMPALTSDKHAFESSLNIAMAILWPLTDHGHKPLSRNKCRGMRRIRRDDNVPDSSINAVINAIEGDEAIEGPFKTHGKQGIVETRYSETGKFQFKDRKGNWQRYG